MSLFTEISDRCDELTEKGQVYLDSLPFVTNDEAMQRIWTKAKEIFDAAKQDWSAVPEWVASTMDGHIPYSRIPHNGSIHFAMGFSVTSMEAHLRNLLERAEGRTTEELDFPILAEMPKTEEEPAKKPRKAKVKK